MRNARYLAPLLLALVSDAPAQWPVNEFAVVDPQFGKDGRSDTVTGWTVLDRFENTAREWGAIGAILESETFEAPSMLPDRPRYGVYPAWYVTDAKYAPQCADADEEVPRPHLTSLVAEEGGYLASPAAYNYLVFAHELTHAIELGSPFGADCVKGRSLDWGPYRWILEGMANTVGLRLKEQRYFGAVTEGVPSGTNIGLRPYKEHLALDKKASYGASGAWIQDDAYHTSTFWDHLVRRYDGLPMLARLLSEKLDTGGDPDGIRWLHAALKGADEKLADTGLYFVYPEFITEFGSFAGTYMRFEGKEFSSADAAREAWLEYVFHGCHEVNLDAALGAGGGVAQVEVDLDRIAAQCLRVKWQGMPRGAELMVEAFGADVSREDIDGLHLGFMIGSNSGTAAGSAQEFTCHKIYSSDPTRCLIKTFAKRSKRKGPLKTWITGTVIEDDGVSEPAGERYFALSNVRPDEPEKTRKLAGLKVVFGFCTVQAKSGQKFGCPRSAMIRGPGMRMMQSGTSSLLYGMADSALMLPGLTGMELPQAAEGAKPYSLSPKPAQISFGMTGAFHGSVARETDALGASSQACGDPEAPIGTIVQSDDLGLHIRISTDLCQFDASDPLACYQSKCPVLERLDIEFFMPFGWRYFGETGAVDDLTPGMQHYVDRFVGAVAERSPISLPGFGEPGSGSETGGGDGDGAAGSSTGATSVFDIPAGLCRYDNCDEIFEHERQCRGVDRADLAKVTECATFINQCTAELMQCEETKEAVAPVAAPETVEADAETERYVAEMKALGVGSSTVEIQSQAFARAAPDLRAKMWNDLEIVREELARGSAQNLQQARVQAGEMAAQRFDEETLRYKAALEQAGKSEVEINGLVSVFSTAPSPVRQALWEALEGENRGSE